MTTATRVTRLSFSGPWRLVVVGRASSLPQRLVVEGSATDAMLAGTAGASLQVVPKTEGVPWTLRLQSDKGAGTWEDSALRLGAHGVDHGVVSRLVESDDGTDGVFDDLVVRLEQLEAGFLFELPQDALGVDIRVQIRDSVGRVLALPAGAGLTVRFILAWAEVTPHTLIRGKSNPGNGRVIDAANGVVAYRSEAGDFSRVGRYKGEFWVTAGPLAFAHPVVGKLDIRVFKTIDRAS
jgi:hypothetical protein